MPEKPLKRCWPDGGYIPLFGSGLTHEDRVLLDSIEAGHDDLLTFPVDDLGVPQHTASFQQLPPTRFGDVLEDAIAKNQQQPGQTISGNLVRFLGDISIVFQGWRS